MPDREYRKHFKFMGGTPGKGLGSLWRCCFCGKQVHASWGQAAKHYWRHKKNRNLKKLITSMNITAARSIADQCIKDIKNLS